MFSFRRHTDKRNGLNIDTREITLEPADNARLLSLCGPFDDNIKQLERRLGIEINRRDNHFKLTGRPICVTAAADILRSLYVDTAPMRGQIQDIEPEQIHLAIKEARVLEQSAESVPEYGKAVNIKTKRGVIKPRTPNQAQYIANILDHDITFGVGPAGTGKTYLAVAAAVDALERQEIRRILLTRPAVEAGEKLGFLPGDLSQKVDPYLRPLYDALFEMLGFEKVEKLIERNVIEVAPLAYMRGRTLNDAFIILDESQNTTIEQMKMFLTLSLIHIYFGCLETIAANAAIEQRVLNLLKQGYQSRVPLDDCTIKTICKAANKGDSLASEVIEYVGRHLGKTIAIAINLFNPQKIVIAGEITEADKVLLPAIESCINTQALKAFRTNLPVVRSELDHRSAIGAFALVKRAMLNGILLQHLLEN